MFTTLSGWTAMAETTLPDRVEAAAEALEELSAMAGYPHPSAIVWNAHTLRAAAEKLRCEVPL